MPRISGTISQRGGHFPTTRWSLLAAAGGSSSEAGPALESLCRAYWLPVYVYNRRFWRSPQDAEDLSQEFFANLLSQWDYSRLTPAHGSFRSYVPQGSQARILRSVQTQPVKITEGFAIWILFCDAFLGIPGAIKLRSGQGSA